MLDAHRQADQPVDDAQPLTDLALHAGVGHDRGMFHQALHAAEALCEREEPQRAEEALRRRQPAGEHEGDHPAEALRLPGRDRMPGM